MNRLLSPADIARRTGVTVRTLHHDEDLGLLAPLRSDAGHRRYRESDVAQLYDADERFAAHFDAVAPGLAQHVIAAIRANQ